MLVEFVKIARFSDDDWRLEKIYINPKHVVYISEARDYKTALMEGRMNLDLTRQAEFSRIEYRNESQHHITVIGSPSEVQSRLSGARRTILRG